ncbi:MAG: hypothetical protein HY901_03135 [Deltaproteobacteria bacterium]|nr:hypothetical protein [Deltaproteobacteria bacterium]
MAAWKRDAGLLAYAPAYSVLMSSAGAAGVRARVVLAAAVLFLAPAAALGCGLCEDAVLRRRFWAIGLPLNLVIALGAEAMAYALFLLARRRKPVHRRAPTLYAAGLSAAIVGLLTEASGLAMSALFLVGLAVSFTHSLLADGSLGRRITAFRIAAVLVISVSLQVRSHPRFVKTPRLVTLALIAPDSWGERAQGWSEEQLVARSDGLCEVEKEIGRLQQRKRPLAQDVQLLRLHRLAGGDTTARAGICAAWGVTEAAEPSIPDWHGRSGPPPGLLRSLCLGQVPH